MLNPVNLSKRRRIVWGVLLVAMLALPWFNQSSFAQSSPPAADTFVSSSFAKTNFGSSIALAVQNGSITLVQFNLSGIPAGATVTKASLRLYVDAVAGNGKFDVYNVTSNWSENSVTYNTRPTVGNSISQNGPFSITASSMNQFLLVDITPEVQGWLNGTIPNNGVALQLTGSGGSFSFDSKESLLTGNGPELEIVPAGTPGPQGPQGPAGAQGATGAPGAQGPAGQQGPPGVDGAPGPTGAQGPAGQGFNFRGAFEASATYAAYDVVSYNGSSYNAKAAINPGDPAPDVNPNWSLMAQQGAAGAQGNQGPAGPAGPQGLQGNTGAAGAQGAPGAQGPPGVDGAQGPKGDPGSQGPQGPGGGLREWKAALLQWYRQDFNVGASSQNLAFDGANIWVANVNENTVSKLRANDGAVLGSFAVGSGPTGVAFDGANIWVANFYSGTVSKLRATDGANLGTFTVFNGAAWLAFDGANIWVGSDCCGGIVSKLRASDGHNLGNFPVPTPGGLAFDGANIWVTDQGSKVRKLRASDGAILGTFAVGSFPMGVAFDGTNIWVANNDDNTVSKLRASDGATLGTFGVGSGPTYLAFDGINIWVGNTTDNTMSKLRASDGANMGTVAARNAPYGVAFDGANIWVANSGDNTVSKF